jgi:hypothetical protein
LLHPHLGIIKNTHDDGASAVGTLVLGEVIATRELLPTVSALERFLMGVERSIMALEMFLAAETTRAQVADKSLGWILGQGLLATTPANWLGSCGGSGFV